MKETNNPILTEYLQDKNPKDYWELNAPDRIVLNINGVDRVFNYVPCLCLKKVIGKGVIWENVYQSPIENKYGKYPIFSIAVKFYKNKYEFYIGWNGTRVWL